MEKDGWVLDVRAWALVVGLFAVGLTLDRWRESTGAALRGGAMSIRHLQCQARRFNLALIKADQVA